MRLGTLLMMFTITRLWRTSASFSGPKCVRKSISAFSSATDGDNIAITPPWSLDLLNDKRRTRNHNPVRVRQHVNPLARRFQLSTALSDDWPANVYRDCGKPLFLDIGVGKGGFLLRLASQRPQECNYLGLEIRPIAVQFAKDRLSSLPDYEAARGHLDFVGCNANVDLKRLLTRYSKASDCDLPLSFCSIQFPDPHFKERHKRRRVVTSELVQTLAQFMPTGAKVFLQSDVQTVLDDMRERFRATDSESFYFDDQVKDIRDYFPENIIGIPTEREASVLNQDLPVYRTVFVRNDKPFTSGSN